MPRDDQSNVVSLDGRQPISPLGQRLMEIARIGAERHRNQVYDAYDLLAIDIMAAVAINEYNAARTEIADLLRIVHKDGPAAALRSKLP